jgi:hypothetical protein
MRVFAVGLLGAAIAFAAPPAHAQRDRVQFFNDIHVTADAPVHDAVCFFCSVRVEGKVTGDIVVFFGSIHLAGDAQHDMVNIFGEIHADDNSSIEDDVVGVFSDVRLGENVTVGKDLVSVFGVLRAPASASVGEDRVMLPAWMFFVPFLVIFLIVFAIVHEYRSYHRRLVERGYKFPPKR